MTHSIRNGKIVVVVLVAGSWIGAVPAQADISLEWRPAPQTVSVNDAVNLGLWAVADDSQADNMGSLEVIFSWDPSHLTFQGLDMTGAASLSPLFGVTFFPDLLDFDLNESDPPQDGDGFYRASTGDRKSVV